MGGCFSFGLEEDGGRVQRIRQAPRAPGGTRGSAEEVLFFPDRAGMPCKFYQSGQGCRRGNRCTYAHEVTSLVKFLRYLGGTRGHLDIAVFSITCNEIADTIFSLKRRGVAVSAVHTKRRRGRMRMRAWMDADGMLICCILPPFLRPPGWLALSCLRFVSAPGVRRHASLLTKSRPRQTDRTSNACRRPASPSARREARG